MSDICGAGRWLAWAFAAALWAGAAPSPSLAQERIALTSFTPPARAEFLRHTGPAVALTADLYLPRGSGPFPALVLKHGSGGMEGPTGANIRKWAQTFAGWGVAALVVDSFGARKISETANNQGQLSTFAEVADALAALQALGADPRIDRTRIGIVGWSRGGLIAMQTALDAVRKVVIADDLKFAAHIAFYGPAMTQYRDKATDGAPFLFLHGELDDYVPIAPAREYAEWLKSMGNPVTFIGYPNAHHDFDVEGGFQGFARNVEVTAKCDNIVNVADGKVLRMAGKPPATAPTAAEYAAYQRTCVTKGARLELNPGARADAVEKVRAFLKSVLKAAG